MTLLTPLVDIFQQVINAPGRTIRPVGLAVEVDDINALAHLSHGRPLADIDLAQVCLAVATFGGIPCHDALLAAPAAPPVDDGRDANRTFADWAINMLVLRPEEPRRLRFRNKGFPDEDIQAVLVTALESHVLVETDGVPRIVVFAQTHRPVLPESRASFSISSSMKRP